MRTIDDITIYTIDQHNAAICLACPLAECVFLLPTDGLHSRQVAKLRQPCPIWQAEAAKKAAALERVRRRRGVEPRKRAEVGVTA